MIFGEISQPAQAGINLSHPIWAHCWKWLEAWTPNKALGIEKFDGDRFFANLHTYSTKEEETCKWEAHRHTVDLQVVLSGGEFVQFLPQTDLQQNGDYDPEKERWIYEPMGSTSSVHLTAGRFAVFFPGEPHRPQIRDSLNSEVVKVVFKIHESLLR